MNAPHIIPHMTSLHRHSDYVLSAQADTTLNEVAAYLGRRAARCDWYDWQEAAASQSRKPHPETQGGLHD